MRAGISTWLRRDPKPTLARYVSIDSVRFTPRASHSTLHAAARTLSPPSPTLPLSYDISYLKHLIVGASYTTEGAVVNS